jgi:hypothetical protein
METERQKYRMTNAQKDENIERQKARQTEREKER